MAREVVYSSQNNHQGAIPSSSSPLMVVIDHWNFSFQKWRFLEDKVSSPLFQETYGPNNIAVLEGKAGLVFHINK